MNNLLIFFALPIAVIIISIALQKILKCPPLVAGIIFALFLVVTFVINNLNFLIATIVYTIISFITAIIVCTIGKFLTKMCSNNTNNFITLNSGENEISNCGCNYQISNSNGLSARVNIIPNTNNNTNNNNTNGCSCCSRR